MTIIGFIDAWIEECGIGPTRAEIMTNAPGWCGLTTVQVSHQLWHLRHEHVLTFVTLNYEGSPHGHYAIA